MDKEIFGSCIGILQQLFGELKNKEVLKIYWQQLNKYGNEKFKSATFRIMETFRPTSTEPFPAISRFVDAIGGGIDNTAILAVSAVKEAASHIGPYRSISFGDRALHGVIEHFGGWVIVSNWHDEEWGFNERKFIDAYKSFKPLNKGPDYLSGLSEDDYRLNSGNYLPSTQKNIAKQIKPAIFEWSGYKQIEYKKNDNNFFPIVNQIADCFSMDKTLK